MSAAQCRRLFAAPVLAAVLMVATVSPALASTNNVPAVKIAATYKGTPYRWGGTTVRGFDCSGYVQYVFKKLDVKLPRTAEEQWAVSKHITRAQLKPGDLVFWGGRGWVYHVGIYAGDNKVWHAPHTGDRVRLTTIWGGSKLYGRVRGVESTPPAVLQSTVTSAATTPVIPVTAVPVTPVIDDTVATAAAAVPTDAPVTTP